MISTVVAWNPDKTIVSISAEWYDMLLKDRTFLIALRNNGVDNWDGYDYAIDELNAEERNENN